jgi:multidrug efflux pump
VIVIPISLIGAFFIMYIAGFTINVLTLLGVVLAIGLVVDDAIVVLENVYAKIEAGLSPIEAGIKGSAEIFFAIIATTVALVAVFMPVIFLEGITGRLFREFGMVLAGSVIISSFVALTLTPMLSTRILKKRERQSWLYRKSEPFFSGLAGWYRNSLNTFMTHRWLAFVIIALSIIMILGIGSQIPSELAPLEDRSGMRIMATAPEGTTYDFMDRYMNELVSLVEQNVPEIDALISITSPGFGAASSVNSGFIRTRLVDPSERSRSQQEIAAAISREVRQLSAARVFVAQDQSIGGQGGGLPVQYVIQAPNFEALRDIVPLLWKRL